MARLNIEDSLFTDKRYSKLILLLGSSREALGAFVEAIILAQKYFMNTETNRMIPAKVWKAQECSDYLINVGLAEVRDDFIYMCGSEDQFSWLLQRQVAGKAGGLKKAANRRRKEAKSSGAGETYPLSLSLPLSPSLSQTQSQTLSQEVVAQQSAAKAASSGAVPEFADDQICFWLLEGCSVKAQRAWLITYPDVNWLKMEMRKAYSWIQSNPQRAPKQMAKFLANWFSRGYEAYRKGQPVNKTHSQKNADSMQDMFNKVDKGEL